MRRTTWDARNQRLVTVALLGHPKLIIVDEPTAGLDPEERSKNAKKSCALRRSESRAVRPRESAARRSDQRCRPCRPD